MTEEIIERKHSRTVFIVAVIAIALAAVGIGYAYAAYTTNSGNTADVEYLTVVPSSDGSTAVYSGSFTKGVELDTVTDASGITYSLADGSFDVIGGHEYSSLGKIYLTVDESKSDDDYNVSVKVTGGAGLNLTDYRYYAYFRIGSGETAEDAKTAAEAATGTLVELTAVDTDRVAESSTIVNDDANNCTVVITEIYVGMQGGDSVLRPIGTPVGTLVLNDVTFGFAAKTI